MDPRVLRQCSFRRPPLFLNAGFAVLFLCCLGAADVRKEATLTNEVHGATMTNGSARVSATNVFAAFGPKTFWEKARAEEAYRSHARREAERLRKERALLDEALALAQLEHSKIRAEMNPPPRPPPFIEQHKEWVVLAFAVFLFTVVTKLALDRHREEAELRALVGGYLSDGTEVARFVMPDLFATPELHEGVKNPWEEKPQKDETVAAPDPLAGFFEHAARTVGELSDLLKELNNVSEPEARREVLARMSDILSGLVQKASPWPLRPAWQVGTALELLIHRVAEKPKDATVSVLRTIAAGLDCLRELCAPGIRPNLIIEPPLKILAVDDDALCRRAVAFALQKAGLAAEFAETGQQAVEMASRTAFDMVFMDIQMPEMDGITAAEKLRESEKNAQTPVVFVTVQSDFQTRAQTTAIGSAELIAKPFLVFEITVKAVISAARKRLALLPRKSSAAASANAAASDYVRVPRKSRSLTKEDCSLKDRFFVDAPRFLAGVTDLLDDISVMTDSSERHQAMADLHVRLVAVSAAAKANELDFTSRLSSAAESLAKKLNHYPKTINASSLRTMGHAVKTLAWMCVPGGEAPFASGPPVRLLVVEDEPLARRAVVGALQLAFERPDSANDAESALSLCSKRRYDVVFCDIGLPGMDGLELCRRLRAEGENTEMPIVFITSDSSADTRVEAAEIGGTDFISKPFLPIEITVKALTLAYEYRFETSRNIGVSRARQGQLAAV